jgi:colicin import membrane protein
MKLNRKGVIGTIIYHTLLVLLLIFAGLTFPDPPPEEEGILVNFGTDDTGFGQIEPMGDDQNAGDPDMPVVQQREEITEQEETPVQPRVERTTRPEPVAADQTQDVEETRVKEIPRPTAEELERQRMAEVERQRIAEEVRQRQEEERIERERREEEARIQRERQQQAERINNMGRNAFGRQGTGQTEGSQGVAGGEGNQGDPGGTPGVDRYGTGGGLGEGITYGLGSGRGVKSLPKPNIAGCEVTSRMEITVDIQVDREGNVVMATVRNATYQEKCIWDMVVDAARKSSFAAAGDATFREAGWIKYIIQPR